MESSTRKQPLRAARIAKKPIQEVELPESPPPKKVKTGDFFKDIQQDDVGVEPEAEEVSDYEKSKKKPKAKVKAKARSSAKKPKAARQASPEIPDMSDMEYEVDREDDLRIFDERRKAVVPEVKATLLPKVLRLEIQSAPTTININISDLLSSNAPYQSAGMNEDLDGTTLMSNEDVQTSEDLTSMRLNPKYASFLELEPELRNRIYRELLVVDKVVKFNPAPRLSRTAALLRTCRQVYEEARGILYGENAFHLDRRAETRGNYWDEEWKEIGYKDVRLFLESIGSANIANMRFLSIRLSDAGPISTPKLDTTERRYQNDPILHHVLRLIGSSGVVLEEFAVAFAGRRELSHDDVTFIRAFTSIKTRKLTKTCNWSHSKVNPRLYGQMGEFMEAPKLENVDSKRRRAPKMEFEVSGYESCFDDDSE